MAAHSRRHREDGEAAGSLLTLLSLNTAKRHDLGGLAALLRQHRPHLVFLQELGPSTPLAALAGSAGYQLFISARGRRSIAALSRIPGSAAVEHRPGVAHTITCGALSFLHLHAPSGNGGAEVREREEFFASVPALAAAAAVPPVLVGDFNAIISMADTAAAHRRLSPALTSLVRDHDYSDAFR